MSFPWSKDTFLDILVEGVSNQDRQKIVRLINTNQITILTTIENLDGALNNKDTEIRLKGTKLFSDILQDLKIQLSKDELAAITSFYRARLHDHHTLYSTLIHGILSLFHQRNIQDDDVFQILKELFQTIPCQSQTREDRFKYLKILEYVGCSRTEVVLPMGDEFLHGIISAIDGERDPRNLILIFSFIPNILPLFRLDNVKEDMFDAFACYFPIDFNPSASDLNIVSREDLAEKLSNCLCCTTSFLSLTIELLLEKLNSDLSTAKIDSLKLLQKCTHNFNVSDISSREIDLIWSTLYRHIELRGYSDVISQVLVTLTLFLKFIDEDKEKLNKVLNNIFEIVENGLEKVNAKAFELAINLIESICKASDDITVECFTNLISKTKSQIEVQGESFELEPIEKITSFCRRKSVAVQLNPQLIKCIENLCVQNLTRHDIEVFKFRQCLNILSNIACVLSVQSRNLIYSKIVEAVFHKQTKYEEQIYVISIELAKLYPNEIKLAILQKIDFDDFDTEAYQFLIKILVRILSVPELQNDLYAFVIQSISNHNIELKNRIILLSTVRLALYKNFEAIEIMVKNGFVEDLIKIYFKEIDENAEVLTEISNTLKCVIAVLEIDQQQKLLNAYLPKTPTTNSQFICLLNGLICCLNEKVDIMPYLNAIVDYAFTVAMNNDNVLLRLASNGLLCSVFNKISNLEFQTNVAAHVQLLNEEISKENTKAVITLGWILKGLVRRSGNYESFLILLINLFNNPHLVKSATEAFGIIVEDKKHQIKMHEGFLYQQKLFSLTLKGIRQLEHSTNFHSVAVLFVVSQTPTEALKIEFDFVASVILDCLANEDQEIVFLSLQLFDKLILFNTEFITKNQQIIIKQLLNLLRNKYQMKIRMLSLQCIEVLSTHAVEVLQIYRKDIVNSLTQMLDDPKRLIRKRTVNARLKWITQIE